MSEIENKLEEPQKGIVDKPLEKETLTSIKRVFPLTPAVEILVLSVTDLPFTVAIVKPGEETLPPIRKYQVLVETSQLLQLNKKYTLVL